MQLARGIAAEYRGYGIRYSASCPGFVQAAHGLRETEELDRLRPEPGQVRPDRDTAWDLQTGRGCRSGALHQ